MRREGPSTNRKVWTKPSHKLDAARKARLAAGGEVSKELFNEDHRQLRFLLVLAGTLCVLMLVFAGNVMMSVTVLSAAVTERAVDAIEGTPLTEPVKIRFDLQGEGPLEVTLRPTDPANPMPLSHAIESVATFILASGFEPAGVEVRYQGRDAGETVVATLWRTEAMDWLLDGAERSADARSLTLRGSSVAARAERAARIAEKCPNRWLPAVMSINSMQVPPLQQLHGIDGQRVPMGRPVWWRWSSFESVSERGVRSPLIPALEQAQVGLNIVRHSTPAWVVGTPAPPLNCFGEYSRLIVGTFGYFPTKELSSIYQPAVKVTSPGNDYLVADAIQALQSSSLATVGDLRIGAFGLAGLLPSLMLLLSGAISLQLRRMSRFGPEVVSHAMWGGMGSGSKLTLIDGWPMQKLERTIRATFLFICLVGPAIVCAASVVALWYPVVAFENMDGAHAWMAFLTRVPAFWMLLALLVLAMHQSMIVFGFGTSRPGRGT